MITNSSDSHRLTYEPVATVTTNERNKDDGEIVWCDSSDRRRGLKIVFTLAIDS